MSTTSTVDFAILAPVPDGHLRSGQKVAQDNGYVCYGTQKWELFREVDAMRNDEPVPVLIYPSHEEDTVSLTYRVSWTAWYIGHLEGTAEKIEEEKTGHRPPTTEMWRHVGDCATGWAVFWKVTDIEQLSPDQHRPISALATKKGFYRKNAPPRGPEIVARPSWI